MVPMYYSVNSLYAIPLSAKFVSDLLLLMQPWTPCTARADLGELVNLLAIWMWSRCDITLWHCLSIRSLELMQPFDITKSHLASKPSCFHHLMKCFFLGTVPPYHSKLCIHTKSHIALQADFISHKRKALNFREYIRKVSVKNNFIFSW